MKERRFTENGLASPEEKQRLLEQWTEGHCDYSVEYLVEAFGTTDFSNAILNVAHAAAMDGVADVPATWKAVSKVVPVNDLKARYIVDANGLGLLEKRLELEPTTLAKPTDAKETYTPYVFDKAFGLTLTAWANDETGKLQEQFRTFGQAAVHTLNSYMWNATDGLLGGTGATMGDSTALFDASGHANYATSTDLTFENLTAGIAAMLIQTDRGGTQIVPMTPRYLIVPPGKEGVANRLTMSDVIIAAGLASTSAYTRDGAYNSLKKYGLQVVVVPELTSTNWILACDPMTHPCVEMGFFIGPEPKIETLPATSDATFFTRKMYSKCTLAFGGHPKDWRTFYKGVA